MQFTILIPIFHSNFNDTLENAAHHPVAARVGFPRPERAKLAKIILKQHRFCKLSSDDFSNHRTYTYLEFPVVVDKLIFFVRFISEKHSLMIPSGTQTVSVTLAYRRSDFDGSMYVSS